MSSSFSALCRKYQGSLWFWGMHDSKHFEKPTNRSTAGKSLILKNSKFIPVLLVTFIIKESDFYSVSFSLIQFSMPFFPSVATAVNLSIDVTIRIPSQLKLLLSPTLPSHCSQWLFQNANVTLVLEILHCPCLSIEQSLNSSALYEKLSLFDPILFFSKRGKIMIFIGL